MSLEVSIIVPDRVFWKDKAKEIILPTLTGQMGILTNHISALTGLDTGVMQIKSLNSDDWINVVIMGGFALVKNNQVTILVNEAELGTDIDFATAESSFLEAQSILEKSTEGRQKVEATLQFKKAKARFQVAKNN